MYYMQTKKIKKKSVIQILSYRIHKKLIHFIIDNNQNETNALVRRNIIYLKICRFQAKIISKEETSHFIIIYILNILDTFLSKHTCLE